MGVVDWRFCLINFNFSIIFIFIASFWGEMRLVGRRYRLYTIETNIK
jgi:hypothetical protein